MPPVGFEPAIPAGERAQTHALDRAATGTGAPFLVLPSSLKVIPLTLVQLFQFFMNLKFCAQTFYCLSLFTKEN